MHRANPTDVPAENARPALALERIVLTGFMGSGKSTLGRILAHKLGWRFVDLDSAIEQRDGRTVAAIFAQSGEPQFRVLESEELARLLHQSQLVLALGGGALESEANRRALTAAPRTRTVLLTASFDTLFERCKRQIEQSDESAESQAAALPVRPLLGDRDAAAARLARRDTAYRQAADIILDTTAQHPQQSVETLLELLKKP